MAENQLTITQEQFESGAEGLQQLGEATGGSFGSTAGGGASGALAGAAIGTAIAPGLGTAIGAVAGGILGAFGGAAQAGALDAKPADPAALAAVEADTCGTGKTRIGPYCFPSEGLSIAAWLGGQVAGQLQSGGIIQKTGRASFVELRPIPDSILATLPPSVQNYTRANRDRIAKEGGVVGVWESWSGPAKVAAGAGLGAVAIGGLWAASATARRIVGM